MRLSKTLPIDPSRFPFFYGWVIVGVSTLGIVASIPGQTMGVSVFTPHLENALDLSSTRLSLAYGIGTVISGLLLVRAGRLVDRFGVRISMLLSSSGLGLSLLILAYCDRIVEAFEVLFGVAAHVVIAMGVAVVGFFFIRFLGQGLMAMISRVMIGKWFHHRRGLAIGLSGVFSSFGFGYSPVAYHDLIEALGWRGAYWALAALVGGGMALVAWIFFRERPEDFGLRQDGREISTDDGTHAESKLKRDFTLEEARHSYEFWLYTFGLGTQGMIVTAVTFHILSIASEAGLTEEQAVAIFLPMSITAVLSNLTGGWVSDKTKLKYLLMVQMTALAVGTASLVNFGDMFWRVLAIVGFGISGGLFGCLVGVTFPRFYGLQHLGAISGQNMSVMVLMTSVGPLLFALSLSLTGSYTAGILLCAALPVLLWLGAVRSGNPQERIGERPGPQEEH